MDGRRCKKIVNSIITMKVGALLQPIFPTGHEDHQVTILKTDDNKFNIYDQNADPHFCEGIITEAKIRQIEGTYSQREIILPFIEKNGSYSSPVQRSCWIYAMYLKNKMREGRFPLEGAKFKDGVFGTRFLDEKYNLN